MNDHHNNHFSSGFVLGLVIGAAAVFLLGTKTGKNLLKIVSEQGLDGIANLLEEYDLSDLEEEDDEYQTEEPQTGEVPNSNGHKPQLKKRFFRRVKR